MTNALDLIDAELEKASAPRVVRKPLMLYLSEGQKAILRPLYELKNILVLQKHSKWTQEKESRIYAICASEKCKYCQEAPNDKKLTPRTTFYLPIFVHKLVDKAGQPVRYKNEENEDVPVQNVVRVLELTAFGTIEQVLTVLREFTRDEENGPITGCDWTLSQSGSGTDKTYTLLPRQPRPMHADIKKLVPSHESLREEILAAFPPAALGSDAKVARISDEESDADHPF